MRKLVSSGSPFEPRIGFSRAVRVGPHVAISGTAPIAADGGVVARGDVYGQTKRCLEIIAQAVADAGLTLHQVIRTRVMLTDISHWEEAARAHGECFAAVKPACTFVEVAAFINPEWLVEVEADCVSDTESDRNDAVGRQQQIQVNPMNNDIHVLHHLGIISRNLEAAVEQYERLGFLFTPLTLPMIPLQAGAKPEPIGAGNRCAIFRNNYLEILGVVDARRWASITREQRGPFDLDAPLERYEGLHVLHLGTEDLDAVRSRLLKRGLSPSDIRPFRRLIDTPDGPQMMRARTLSFPPGSNPEALFQIAQHETPELVLQPRYMQHPNGATSITEVIVCVQDPDSVANKYGLYAGRDFQKRGDLRVIELDQSRIIVVSPDHLQAVLPGQTAPTVPFLAGFAVSSNLDTTKQALNDRGIEFQIHGGRILVSAREGYGASVLFEDINT